MSDQKDNELMTEARSVLEVDDLLRKSPYGKGSKEWNDWLMLFDAARKVYPRNHGWNLNPHNIEQWVSATANGDAPRPNADDLRKGNGAYAAFFQQWSQIVKYADRVLSALSNENSRQSNQNMTGSHRVVRADGSTSPDSSRGPIYYDIKEFPRPTSHGNRFISLSTAITSVRNRGNELMRQFSAMQSLLTQFTQETQSLQAVHSSLENMQWITSADYRNAEAEYNELATAYRKLTEETHRLAYSLQDTNRKREEARMLTVEKLIEEIRHLWRQFNLQSEAGKERASHDADLATQTVNNLARVLHDTCSVDLLRISNGDQFDPNYMTQANAAKTKDKNWVGTVAQVIEPGFQDQLTQEVYPAKVDVYVG